MRTVDDTVTSALRMPTVGVVFCVSGFSALVYQVAWQRILALHSGVGIYSVAMIVAAFMAGLGLGSYAGGVLSQRIGATSALRAFAALELGIGLFALASCYVYYDLLYLRFSWLYGSLWRAAMFHFLALALPTTLMGMSLPFLVRATVRDPRTASRRIGFLYGINVVGAALGALLAPWILIRLFGITGAVRFAAAGNLFAGVAAVGLGFLFRADEPLPRVLSATPPAASAEFESPGSRPFPLWVSLYALSGFCALSLEILWFRVVDIAVKSTAFTFGTVLSIFLFGLAAGSLVGGPLAVRLGRPLKAFLACQCFLLAYSGAAAFLLVLLPPELPFYRTLVDYWGEYEGFGFGEVWEWASILRLYLVVPAFLFGPPTFLMGLSFAILQRAVHDDQQTSGLKVGMLQAANIAGNVAGSLVTGLVCLRIFGTWGTLSLLLTVGLLFAGLGIRYYGLGWLFVAPSVVLIGLLLLLPRGPLPWLRLHGMTSGIAPVAEDASAVVAIVPEQWKGVLRLSVDGKGHSWLPFGFFGIHNQLGAIPSLIHPKPEDIAIVGLGSGATAWGAACRPETRRLSVFEIAAPEMWLLRDVATKWPQLSDLRALLEDPRLTVFQADGRNALALGEQQYDVIEADAIRPQTAYSGNLYSVEFFRLCARKLKHGGLMCTWGATPRVRTSFREVFPIVLEFAGGQILVGSNDPIGGNSEVWFQRLRSPQVAGYVGTWIGPQIGEALGTAHVVAPASGGESGLNHDLFPRDEFQTPLAH